MRLFKQLLACVMRIIIMLAVALIAVLGVYEGARQAG